MARRRVPDDRFDWSHGVNTTFSPDVLGKRELRKLENGRAGVEGYIRKVPGSQRIHDSALGVLPSGTVDLIDLVGNP